jgi:hypothetical protein
VQLLPFHVDPVGQIGVAAALQSVPFHIEPAGQTGGLDEAQMTPFQTNPAGQVTEPDDGQATLSPGVQVLLRHSVGKAAEKEELQKEPAH